MHVYFLNKIGDLRKLFKLLKERQPLWDKDNEYFYHAKTVSDLWLEVFQKMNKKGKFFNILLVCSYSKCMQSYHKNCILIIILYISYFQIKNLKYIFLK